MMLQTEIAVIDAILALDQSSDLQWHLKYYQKHQNLCLQHKIIC